MARQWDGEIQQVYPAASNSLAAVDTVDKSTGFDIVVNFTIGERLNEVVTKYDLWITVYNLSKFSVVESRQTEVPLTPEKDTARYVTKSVSFGSIADAEKGASANAGEGDVLQAVASLKVSGGIYNDYTSQQSRTFIVTTG